MRKKLVSENRMYAVRTVADAKDIARQYLQKLHIFNEGNMKFGLPEIDDRFHIWRVPLRVSRNKIGEVVIHAKVGEIDETKTTKPELLAERKQKALKKNNALNKQKSLPIISELNNTVILGDSIEELDKLPEESVNLVFTSPPYYNAKPEYSEYSSYEEYLELMRKVIRASAKILSEGRFFVLNVSPVLLRRASRSEASKRIAVPFDFHRLFIEEGFDFIDDIHWVKPEGAGWAFGRGRRFAADRNPLQYKPVPVTEYVLVYRKRTDELIDWNIRKHPDQEAVKASRIDDDYETTNLWRINPSRSKVHPATFPEELAEKVIRYYSFKNDVILDPFGGTGTTAKAAISLNRRFVMSELEEKYVEHMKSWMSRLPGFDIDSVNFVNTDKPSCTNRNLDFLDP
ncbi:MAG: site-specific DNA-methyltransferase [Gammaproteobacteria bacterium AqS3]|nr:site-specific DNA-methyltransferase [Gammaproteobacteria bacterium AqS3]